jgi:hypothetical protein
MARFFLPPAILLAALLARAGAQTLTAVPPTASEGLASLGLRLGRLPDLLYAQLPQLKRGAGVVVEHVQSESAAAQAGLRRHDILLSYGGKAIRGIDHFWQFLPAAVPDRPVPLILLRGGREMTLDITWTRAAAPVPLSFLNLTRGTIKPSGPPAVNVEAQRVQSGKLKVTFTYYLQGTGKLERVTCSGSLAQIESEVRELGKQNRMPSRVQDLVDVALRQIRVLNFSQENQ